VVLPLMWPGLAVVALYTFIAVGELLRPVRAAAVQRHLPASVGIYTFFAQYAQVVYGQLAAYSLLYSLPRAALLALSRRLAALTFGGGVKG